MKNVGTISIGVKTPVIKEGDNLRNIVVDSILKASGNENFEIKDRDIVAITEAVVGIATGNYVTVDDIATDIRDKYPNGEIGLVFPILSRNRFSMILKGIARGADKIYMLLSYPADEVGNHLFSEDLLDKYNINPYSDSFGIDTYNKYFGDIVHEFTGVNYVDVYTDNFGSNCAMRYLPQQTCGDWIYSENGDYRCSKCKKLNRYSQKYCPNCGAIMDSDGE